MKTVAITKLGNLRDPDEAARGRVEVIDLPEHEVGPEDVRIRVAYSSICGSDPHLAEGYGRTDVPFGIGHEVSGVVAELGPQANKTGLKVGDRVACNFLKFCGTCTPCRDGRQQFCEFRTEYRRPGMAEEVVWHESQVYKLPDSVSLLQGCMLEPTTIAVRIADKARIRVGDRVLICGGGPIGQLAMQVMARDGATSLTLVEPLAERREMALRTGAEFVIDPINEDQQARADEITQGRGYDVVIDASGSIHAVRGLLDLVALGGTLIYGAMYPPAYDLELNLAEYMYRRELTLTGVFIAPYAFPRAVQLLPHLQLDDLTAAVFDLDDAAHAFDEHMSGKHAKVVLRCNDFTEQD